MHKGCVFWSHIKPRNAWWLVKNNGGASDHRIRSWRGALCSNSRAQGSTCVGWSGVPTMNPDGSEELHNESPQLLRTKGGFSLHPMPCSSSSAQPGDAGVPLQIPCVVMNAKAEHHRHVVRYLTPANGLHFGAYCDNLEEHKIKFPFNEELHTLSEQLPTKAGACFQHN